MDVEMHVVLALIITIIVPRITFCSECIVNYSYV